MPMLKHVVVCGAGVMGHSIALLHALKTEIVWLTDINEKALYAAKTFILDALHTLEQCQALSEPVDSIFARIQYSTDMHPCLLGADLVVEAVSEQADVKREVFVQVARALQEGVLQPDALVASNTSTLDVFALAPVELQSRLFAAHHFVPPHIIPLVEVVSPKEPLAGATERLMAHYQRLGAVPVLMETFCPGFVINRLQFAIHKEMFALLEEGVITPANLDLAVKASLGIRIAALGVVKRLDFAGLDLVLGNMKRLGAEVLPTVLQALVEHGNTGVQAGKGFYDYGSRSVTEIYRERDEVLLRVRQLMHSEGLLLPTEHTGGAI